MAHVPPPPTAVAASPEEYREFLYSIARLTVVAKHSDPYVAHDLIGKNALDVWIKDRAVDRIEWQPWLAPLLS